MRQHDLRGEDGSLLIVAILLMSVMLSIAVSSFAFVDGQQQRATEQRQRETALNLAEGVLYAQGFALARNWPGNLADGNAMPTACSSSSSVVTPCPDPRTLAAANSSSPASANFTNADASQDVTWTTRIRDNGGPLTDAFDVTQMNSTQTTGAVPCPGPCKWDANGDLKLWVQAQAIVRGRPRNLVALLKREEFAESFGANNAVTAGSFETTNSGNKAIIDVAGSQVVVRCPVGPGCTDYDTTKGQVQPAPVSIPETPRAMTSAQLERFKAAAQSANPSTYYTSCPTTYAGRVVFVDLPAAATTCTDSNSATYNSAAKPGILIVARGKLSMKSTFYGLVYMVNGPGDELDTSDTVLTVAANGQIIGGLAIDGLRGRLVAGQASGNLATIKFDPNAFNSLVSFGTAGLVQNTWRELPPVSGTA